MGSGEALVDLEASGVARLSMDAEGELWLEIFVGGESPEHIAICGRRALENLRDGLDSLLWAPDIADSGAADAENG
jgi:hypothetical protein